MKLYYILILLCQTLFFTTSIYAVDIKVWSSNQDTTIAKTCFDCHNTLVSKKIIHPPAEESCENCHVSNNNVHPGTTKGFSLADNVPTLCFYCHEEYSKKNVHPPAESGECAMCHSLHSSDNSKLLNESRTDKLCFECHDLEIPETNIVHGPVKEGACHECHDSHQSNNRSFLIDKSPKLCFSCHGSVEEQLQLKNLHAPFEDDCSNCHQSHSSGHKGLLQVGVPALCFNCHEEYSEKYIHAPAESGECFMCHNSHGSNNFKLLNESRTDKLCFECHDLEIPEANIVHSPVKEGACHECHDSHQSNSRSFLIANTPKLCLNCHSSTKEQMQSKNLHAPFEDDCFNCHQPHNASEKGLILEKTPTLCFNCHGDVQELIDASKFVHEPMIDEKSCNNCHSPHGSSENAILLKAEKDLCLGCHSRTYTTESGKTKNIKLKLKQGNNIHAPVDEGCVICHKPHASNNYAILNNNFPSGNYADAKEENFALCFECHDSGLILSEFTTDATNFRNGNVNMHYLHINGEKGRSCNTCHDVHGTKGKFLISDKVLFGNWEMDMNYVVKEFGGSCATGCHAEEEYNRNFEQLLVTENSLTNESTKVVPNKRYQDYSEHVQSIDVSVIEFNERAEKQMIEKNDSMDQILPTQNDVVLTEDEYTMQVLSQLAVDTVIDLAPNQQESDKILEENILIDTITNKDIALNEPVKKEVSKEIKPNELLNKDTDTEQKIETIDEGVDAIDFPIKNFAFSTSEIDSEGEKLIIPLVEYLKKNLSVNIELHGHTDSIGSADYNQYLSILRANKVKEFLVKNGIEGTRIKVRGFGESKPLTPNSNSKERAQNRRVEFVILNNEN